MPLSGFLWTVKCFECKGNYSISKHWNDLSFAFSEKSLKPNKQILKNKYIYISYLQDAVFMSAGGNRLLKKKKKDTWPSTAMNQSEVVTIQWLFKKVSEIVHIPLGSKITC